MGRPKGSKNKSSRVETPENIVEQEFEQDEEQEQEVLEALDDTDADDTDEVEPVRPPQGMSRVDSITDQTLLQAFREQTEVLKDMMPPKRVSFARFKTRSKFNPSGRKRKLKYIVYQNGYRCNPKTLHDSEFEAINSGKIRPGQYLSKVVTVRIERAASPEDQDKIHISYNNKTPDQRMMNKDLWNGFGDLLNKIVAESEARKVRLKQRQQREAVQ